MKPLYLLLFLLYGGIFTAAGQDTLYYDLLWHSTSAQNASFYRTRIKTATGWQVVDHWSNSGRRQMTGTFIDDSLKNRVGEFTWYDSTGAIEHSCTYANNRLNGVESYYYPNGQVKMTGMCTNDKYEGAWTGYYPSGKISARAVFHNGDERNVVCYNEDGSPNDKMKKFLSESDYPGGVSRWLRFLNKTLRYPDSALKYNIEGTVVIGFKVSKDGKASEFAILQSVEKSLDAEAMRVLQMSKDWEPAIYAGIYSDSYKTQPIIFKLTQ